MKNVISQSLGLDIVNINVYPTVFQNIPLIVNPRRNTVINQPHLPYSGTSQPNIIGSSYPYSIGSPAEKGLNLGGPGICV